MSAQFREGKGRGGHLMKQRDKNIQIGNMPPIPEDPDETWWATVLADEPLIEEQPQRVSPPSEDVHDLSEVNETDSSVNWEIVKALFKNDEIISLEAVSFNRGGVLVEGVDVHGFVPASHLIEIPTNITDDEREPYLSGYLNRVISLKVIEYDQEKERIVFSERAALAGAGQRKVLLASLAEGDVVSGFVTNVTSFGVFVDLGGLEGLLHVSELSWGRVQHPSMLLKVGDQVETMVIEILEDQGRIALSLKRLQKNPWDELSRELTPGDTVDATITSIVKYGAFARLEEGIEGLIHVSLINLPEDCRRIDDFLYEGQPVKVGIISIDSQKRRLGLRLESS